jgi:hypothetical protein
VLTLVDGGVPPGTVTGPVMSGAMEVLVALVVVVLLSTGVVGAGSSAGAGFCHTD